MNYDKLYSKKYKNNNKINYGNLFKFTNQNNNLNLNTKNNNTIKIKHKVEELLVKLQFINNTLTNTDIINEDDIISKIENIILELNKQILQKAKIKRKNKFIEFEF